MPPACQNVLPRLCTEDFSDLESRAKTELVIHTWNLTSNVKWQLRRGGGSRRPDPLIPQASQSAREYSSSMCSNVGHIGPTRAEAELAARLAAAIDELAAAAEASEPSEDVVSHLARAWAMITAADPDLAARTAGYSRS